LGFSLYNSFIPLIFNDLQLLPQILKAIEEEGYTQPTPIQEKAIPHLLAEKDLLGIAQTGTGKTAAFAIPILQLLHGRKGKNGIKALILTPTRELAIQIDESFKSYGRHLPLKTLVIFGGVSQFAQTEALKKNIDILVATPGRLLDLMDQKYIHLQGLEFFVLDEADRMLDMGFVHDVKKIIGRIPRQRQSIFFSATMPPEIVKLSADILQDPVKVEVTPAATTAQTIQQGVYLVDKPDKKALLAHVLKDKSIKRALVFTKTKHGADKVVKDLLKINIKSAAIHGNKSQNARQKALSDFKNSHIRVLVATDIAARGIDVDDLGFVINYELPNIPESYVHRIGRTGRAGAEGRAISFCDEEEKEFLRDIQKLIGNSIPIVADNPFPLANQEVEKPKPVSRKPANDPSVKELPPSSALAKKGKPRRWFGKRR
jgi:ATP-dependent RNA helicase RhlE